MTSLDTQIAQALERVKDPCSVAAGAPLSLLEMGLVRGWRQPEAGSLEVTLDTTSPMCLMAGHMIQDAQEQLQRIPGVRRATVRIQASGDWSRDSISPEGQRKLQHARSSEAALPAR